MPRGIPNKKPAKRGRKIKAVRTSKESFGPSIGMMMPLVLGLTQDIRRALDERQGPNGWASLDTPQTSAQIGPSLALLQERIALSLDQSRKQFDRLSQLGDRICGPATPPNDAGGTTAPVPGGQLATLNAQMNAMDQIMARIDDQIARLEAV